MDDQLFGAVSLLIGGIIMLIFGGVAIKRENAPAALECGLGAGIWLTAAIIALSIYYYPKPAC